MTRLLASNLKFLLRLRHSSGRFKENVFCPVLHSGPSRIVLVHE
jgi:hypothetical protein